MKINVMLKLIQLFEQEFHRNYLWIEDVFLYTLHAERKEWSEAEAECQREGGHLASATSQEVENMLMRVESGGDSESFDNAYSNSITHGHRFVWLGGRKELGWHLYSSAIRVQQQNEHYASTDEQSSPCYCAVRRFIIHDNVTFRL